MFFERLLVYDDPVPSGAALNMAMDESLLESCRDPVLRFYRWDKPAISFGYFGEYSEVADRPGRELVRRWTGGGIVPHGNDLTYSLITPVTDPAAAKGPPAIYAALHAAIRDALASEGRASELAAETAPKISEACFANPVRHDLLLDGRKIAGAAQRRTRRGFLHQGSIQLPDLSPAFRHRFASLLGKKVQAAEIPSHARRRAEELARDKYGTREWLRRR